MFVTPLTSKYWIWEIVIFSPINRSVIKLVSPINDTRIQYATWSPGNTFEIVNCLYKYSVTSLAVVSILKIYWFIILGICGWIYNIQIQDRHENAIQYNCPRIGEGCDLWNSWLGLWRYCITPFCFFVIIVFILEEVLATNYAMWWAPDGEHILYAVFNDSIVRDFDFPYYGDPSNAYTDIKSIAYPKVSCCFDAAV